MVYRENKNDDGFAGVEVRRTRRIIGLVIVFAIIILGFQLGTGTYTFTPQGTLRSTSLGNARNSSLLTHLKYSWCNVYLFKTASGYATAIVERRGLFWHLSGTWNLPNISDPVKTVGWASIDGQDHQLAVLAVETSNPQVVSIEAGPPTQRQQKPISLGKPIIFVWDNTSFAGNNYSPIALSANGKELYYYGYPKNTTTFIASGLKWYPSS